MYSTSSMSRTAARVYIARSRKRDSERQLEEVSIDWRERLYLHDLYWELAFGLYVVTCMYYCTSLGYYNKL